LLGRNDCSRQDERQLGSWLRKVNPRGAQAKVTKFVPDRLISGFHSFGRQLQCVTFGSARGK